MTTTSEFPAGYRVMVTGHRDVFGARADASRPALRRLLEGMMVRRGALVALTGMALGADVEFGEVALDLGLSLVAAVPSPDQDDRWSHRARERYRTMLARASLTVRVWEEPGYACDDLMGRFHARNRWLVEHSDAAIAVWDGRERGGTWHAVREVLKRGRKLAVVDPRSGSISIR